MELVYDKGTLLLLGVPPGFKPPSYFRFDPRVGAYRALAKEYWAAARDLPGAADRVLNLPECSWREVSLPLRPYQEEALDAWLQAGRRGVVVLPTGAGKTMVALAAIAELRCPTLVVVPTLELVDQWVREVQRVLRVEASEFTGESKEVGCVTVATYSSAYLNAELLGNRFQLLVFDEVHHLPSESYRQIAELSAAPWRMGLTATPERPDGLHMLLPELVGPVVYRVAPGELKGRYLADFEVQRVYVEMPEAERKRYEELVARYERLLAALRMRMRTREDFERLVLLSSRDLRAREALLSLLEARRIAFNAEAKLEKLAEILERHRGEKILVFTDSNELVRRISHRFLVPEITHKTSKDERRAVLEMFRRGEVKVIATSHVLDEGVDVPDASVAVVISGTGSPREFIQRLGRLLRPKEGKRAVLYELVTRGTREVYVSRRRRVSISEGKRRQALKGR
uniref:DNA 3'-5' helicase n=1 Tax=Thermofilum pendens TaxID=2269 RepID=A0A7J3X6L5_THEPE